MIKLYGMDIWWISPDDQLPENNGNLCAVIVKGNDDMNFGVGITTGDEICKQPEKVIGWVPLPSTDVLIPDNEEGEEETTAG